MRLMVANLVAPLVATASLVLDVSALAASAPAPKPGTAAARIEGRVTDGSGEPIAAVAIRLVERESAYARAIRLLDALPVVVAAHATSAADGSFELLVPAPGNYDVVAEVSGWVSTSVALGPVGRLATTLPRSVALTLERGRSVRIAPAADQLVLQEPSTDRWVLPGAGARSWPQTLQELRSDADGVELVVPPAGSSTWRIGRPGVGALPAICRIVGARRCSLVDQPFRRVVLELVRADKPVLDAVAVLGPAFYPVGRSDETGRVEVPVPVAGRSSLVVLAADGGRAELVLVDPGDSEQRPVVRVVVPPATRTVVAVVAAESRAPLAGVAVGTAAGAFGVSPANGRVELVAAPGEGVAATAAGRLDASVALDGSGDTTMALVASAAVRVRVVDELAKPIVGAWVRAEPVFRPRPGPVQLPARLTRRSDASGRVLLDSIDPSFDWKIVGTAPGRAAGRLSLGALAEAEPGAEHTLVLAPGSLAWALVVDQQDQPIAGAEVSLELVQTPSPATMSFGPGEPPQRTTTNSEGRAKFDQVAVGTFVLEAKAPGFAATRVPGLAIELAGSETELGTVVLAPEVRVELDLVDSEGEPVAGASGWIDEQLGNLLMMRTGSGERVADGVSDRHGRLSLGGQRAGAKLSVLVRAEGFAEASATLDVDPEAEPMRITLELVSQLGGRVVDEAGAPIPGATVGLELMRTVGPATFGMPRGETETADDGSFLFEGLEPGSAFLTASAPGRRTVRKEGITVGAGESQLDHELRLEPGATITGSVTNSEGTPLEGVRVLIAEGATPAVVMMTRSGVATNANGGYRLEGAAVGRRLIEAHAPGFRPGKVELELVAGANVADFVLERGASISGRVVLPGGEPAVGARVRVAPEHGLPSFGAPSHTADSQGRFRLDGLEPGAVSLVAEAEGFAATQSAPIEAVGEVTGVELVLERGARIVGELRGLSLDQLGRVVLAAMSRSAGRVMGRADFEGRYTVEGVGVGRWTVHAMVEGRAARGEVEVPPGVSEVTLDLEMNEGATLIGRVVVDGEPGAGLRVLGSRTGAPGFFGSTDPAGGFRFEGLAAATYRVTVSDGMTTLGTREVEVEEPQTTVELEIRPAMVEGMVVSEADGSPVVGASVSASSESSRALPVETDGSGRFRIRRLAPGPSVVVASAEGFAQRRLELELAEGAIETVELELAAAAGLSFWVSGVNSETVMVGLLGEGARLIHSASARIGPEGVVRTDSAPAGEWEVGVWPGWGAPGLFFRATVPGEGPRITVPRLASVEVTVPEADGVEVELVASDSTGAVARWLVGTAVVTGRKSSSGRISLVLFEGTWTLQATAPDGRRWSSVVVATPAAPASVELGPS